MSDHPIDVLRGIFADYQDVLSAPDVDRGMDALRAVERLEEAARDSVRYPGRSKELRAALALFDRKEQTP